MALDAANIGGIAYSVLEFIVKFGGVALLLGIAAGVGVWHHYNKKFNWIVRLYEKDANGQIVALPNDRGGMFLDRKTKNRLFLLKKNKFGLEPDNVPYTLDTKGRKITHIVKTGLKNFQFMVPEIHANPGIVFNVRDEDVAWAINAYTKFKVPDKHDLWKQIMPIVGIAVFGVVVLGVIYMILQEFSVLSEVAASLQDATQNMAKINLGTTVVE